MWDGKTESDASSESSSEDKSTACKPRRSKTERLKKATESHRHLRAISQEFGKLEGFLHHKPSISKGHCDGKTDSISVPGRPEPRVLHGHTLTRETTFREVCYAIRDSAFVTSDLPVIVSLEVHTCLEQQQTMVEIMEDAWKGMLVEVTPEIEARMSPPSLADLKRKILIKVKHVDSADENDDREAKEKAVYSAHMQALKLQRTPTAPDLSPEAVSPAPHKPSKILQALSKLAVFTKGFHFSNFAQPGRSISTSPE